MSVVEIVPDQNGLAGLGVANVQQLLDLMREVKPGLGDTDVEADHREPWIMGTAINLQNVFHAGNRLGIVLGGNPPAVSPMRSQNVFLAYA